MQIECRIRDGELHRYEIQALLINPSVICLAYIYFSYHWGSSKEPRILATKLHYMYCIYLCINETIKVCENIHMTRLKYFLLYGNVSLNNMWSSNIQILKEMKNFINIIKYKDKTKCLRCETQFSRFFFHFYISIF